MTTLVAMIGLFPAAVSTGIGSQTQKPLAIVVIGGAFLVALVARAVQPPLLLLAHSWLEKRQRGNGAGGPHSMHPPPVEDNGPISEVPA
jgi:cobalt-zinc-cadmium resistance protein CzcA